MDLAATSFDQLVQEFRDIDDREAELEFLLELGQQLPEFPNADRNEENRVHGCLSQAWVKPRLDQSEPPRLIVEAASDSLIVGGIIAVLKVLFTGKTAAEAAAINVRNELGRIGLERHLSPQRRNGLYGMVKRIQAFAVAFA